MVSTWVRRAVLALSRFTFELVVLVISFQFRTQTCVVVYPCLLCVFSYIMNSML